MTQTCPIVHVAVADAACRVRITDALHRHGWSVVEQRTGFHLLQAIADVIDSDPPETISERGEAAQSPLPALLVVDAIARGCAGVTIAAGLRELGVRIPLVLVAQRGDPLPECDDHMVRIAGPSDAPAAIVDIAREIAAGVMRGSRDDEPCTSPDRPARMDSRGASGARQGADPRATSAARR